MAPWESSAPAGGLGDGDGFRFGRPLWRAETMAVVSATMAFMFLSLRWFIALPPLMNSLNPWRREGRDGKDRQVFTKRQWT